MKRQQLYESEREAAEAWAKNYRPKSQIFEYAAIIYCIQLKIGQRYFYHYTGRGSRTGRFMRAHVILPFLYLYGIESLWLRVLHHAIPAAFIHSHPSPPAGYTMKNHSKEDLALLKIPGINAVYVIPYEDFSINRVGRSNK